MGIEVKRGEKSWKVGKLKVGRLIRREAVDS